MLAPTPSVWQHQTEEQSIHLRPFVSVLVHTKSAVRPAQEQHPLQESISRSLSSSPASGNYTLFKPFTWLENIFVSLIESQLILIYRKASSVIRSNTSLGKRIIYIWIEIPPQIINIFSKSKDCHFIHCSTQNLIERPSIF